ncbi:MAG: hypothetical protein ACTSRP_00445 [Candidatus Helarchaeota archaeon]
MSWSEKIKNALGKIFHKPTITIEKTNILLYITLIMIFIIALLARLMPLFYHDAELHALLGIHMVRIWELLFIQEHHSLV